MLKLSDPFEMNDLFTGIFYVAETEALANEGEGSQKSKQRLKRLYRRSVRAVWRKLLRAFEGMREAVIRHATRYVPKYSLVREKAVGLASFWRKFEPLMIKYKGFQLHTQEETPSEALPPEFHHWDAEPNENAASELRPLTKEEKRQFLNSLDEKGRRILEELAGKNKKRALRRSLAQVVAPNSIGIAPDKERTPTFKKGMPHMLYSYDLRWNVQCYRVHWLN